MGNIEEVWEEQSVFMAAMLVGETKEFLSLFSCQP